MQVEAKVIADSVSPDGVRLVTIEGTMHRFVLAELNKHRMLSNSAQSSRAVPVKKMLELVRKTPAYPLYWGANQRGMSASEESNNPVHGVGGAYSVTREGAWKQAAIAAATWASNMDAAGYHKQIVNRLVEPFLWQKIVITGTEWDNFFWLRCHKDAQPEIRAFAEAIRDAMNESLPEPLQDYQWHMPYVNTLIPFNDIGDHKYETETGEPIPDLQTAKKYSAARCATTSYRTEKVTLERALKIYDLLVESNPWHSVPLEHVARPLEGADSGFFEDDLTTHVDRNGWCWSGNHRGWGQMRKEVEGAKL